MTQSIARLIAFDPRRALLGVVAVTCVVFADVAAGQASPRPTPVTVVGPEAFDQRDAGEGVSFEQKLGDPLPLEAKFVDHRGESVTLGSYFDRSRPVILALWYADCPLLCSAMMQGLVRNLKGIALSAGQEFDLVIISIDPTEDSDDALKAWNSYTRRYGRAGSAEGWHFLTGEKEQIDAVADAIGFEYRYESATGEYAHYAGVVVATPRGVLSRYFYGTEYPSRDLRLALVEASEEQIGTLADKVLLLCLTYDPQAGKYGFEIMSAIRIGGLITMLIVAVFVIRHLRKDRTRMDTPPAESPVLHDSSSI